MGRAEAGTPKYIANKMKATGLQRLRWYCQVCEKQCRDENGFKCHTQSESHVRNMLLVGENAGKKIDEFSNQFLRDFIYLLRTGHGEKPVNANRYYQEYIANKNHIHMNATKWTSLTELVKYLGKHGICRVKEDEKEGLTISWIDNSPEALQRQEALRKKQRSSKDDESVRQALLNKQIERAEELRKESTEKEQEKEQEVTTLDEKVRSVSLSLKKCDPIKDESVGSRNAFKPGNAFVSGNAFKPRNALKPGNPLQINAFKANPKPNGNPLRLNPLSSKVSKASAKPSTKPLSALERIMMKEQATGR